MEQGKLWLGIMVMVMLGSAAMAGGPLGAPRSVLDEGQWGVDVGYFTEEMDLWGCMSISDWEQDWLFADGILDLEAEDIEDLWIPLGPVDDDEAEWGVRLNEWSWDYDPEVDDLPGESTPEDIGALGLRFQLQDFETSSIFGSLEYGLCENWDLIVRLGAVEAEGNWVVQGADYEWEVLTEDDPDTDDENERTWHLVEEVFGGKASLKFDYGFAWQVGTAFTICETDSVTWGGRMQFGMSDPGSDSFTTSRRETERIEVGEDEEVVERTVETETTDVDVDWWDAVAYLGPTWQINDSWSIYGGGGWQVLQANVEYKSSWLETSNYAVEDYYNGDASNPEDDTGAWDLGEGAQANSYRGEQKGKAKVKHASAILVFGAAFTPSDATRVSADILIGEGGKFGWGISGLFRF